GNLKGRKIAALGLAYKPDVDDLRESPAAEVIHLLQKEGALVKAFEPFKPEGLPNMDCVPTLEAAVSDAEAVLLLVNHTQFRALTPEKLRDITSAKVLVDTVNAWAGQDWEKAGFTYHRLGVNK
ncbi:MAG TPA: UDP binding domain-containing protein, partial [Anaerolineales bacterium]|nr:UDP binding domain-containing protein [Anaerolineales bacterium]